jgi:Fe2+ or Zn2+ uptake regulation protein
MTGNSHTFTCETCNNVFDLREQLREHSVNEHEGKKGSSTKEEMTFSCETCKETFTSREDLRS